MDNGEIRIEKENEKAYLYTPYNPAYVAKIKNIANAKWDSKKKCWVVPEKTLDDVRNIMRDIYGYDDISGNETLDLKITFNSKMCSEKDAVMLFNKFIAIASGRDSGAKAGKDVSIIEGNIRSGGSAKHWYSVVEEGTTMILYNVNKNVFISETDNYSKEELTIEVINSNIDVKALYKEKQNLLARLNEIDQMLDKLNF